MAAPAPAEFVTIARVVKTQGRRGELAADPLTDFPQRFTGLTRVFLRRGERPPQPFPLRRHWFHKGRVVLELEGLQDMTAAEAWIGAEVQVPRSERVVLGADRYFVDDLRGSQVRDGDRLLGTLETILEIPGGTPLLRLRGERGEEILLPFARAYVVAIDAAAGRIALALPPGLADLND